MFPIRDLFHSRANTRRHIPSYRGAEVNAKRNQRGQIELRKTRTQSTI